LDEGHDLFGLIREGATIGDNLGRRHAPGP
jgi:hypothetical protein